MKKTVDLGHRGKRFLAFFIDALVIGFVNGMISGYNGESNGSMGAISTIIGAVYIITFWIKWDGQTPGKRIMNLKVVKEDGSKFTISDAIMRYVGYLISGAVFMIGFIWILFDEKKQGWHDKIAKTLVVTANK